MTAIGGSASFPALGTTASLLVDDECALADAQRVLEDEIRAIDESCSRFRSDSDLSRVNAAAGTRVRVSPRCIEAIEVALDAATETGGIVDPTVGSSMRILGYDRDFSQLQPYGPALHFQVIAAPGWQGVELDRDACTVRVPKGVELDLGATAKALCADRAARAIHASTGAAVVVGLGGDLSVAGRAPGRGWSVRVADDHTATEGGQTVAIHAGGLATSGTTRRTWTRGEVTLHHLVDPRTGTSAQSCWRTASVAARSCVDANVASTASIVLGADALDWLAERALPARLVTRSGEVVAVGGWPEPTASAAPVAPAAPVLLEVRR